jgi:hypothetical protein
MLSVEYRKTKERIEKLDRLLSQALILSESLNPEKDALLLYKKGELESLKEKIYDKAADKFLKLDGGDPAMKNVIHFLSLGLDQRMSVVEKAVRQFLNDISKERSSAMGGWFDSLPDMNAANDKAYGEKAMQYYFDAASNFGDFHSVFPTFNDLKNYYGSKWDAITDGLGLSWRLNQDRLSDSDVESGMANLAMAGNGKLPLNVSSYPQALGKEAMNSTWLESVAFASLPVLQPFADVGNAITNTVTNTASTLEFITRYKVILIPLLAAGAYLYFVGFKDPRKLLGK